MERYYVEFDAIATQPEGVEKHTSSSVGGIPSNTITEEVRPYFLSWMFGHPQFEIVIYGGPAAQPNGQMLVAQWLSDQVADYAGPKFQVSVAVEPTRPPMSRGMSAELFGRILAASEGGWRDIA